MNNFTPEEIKAAKATRSQIIQGDIPELKSIYMAGEICMWDEIQSELSEKEKQLQEAREGVKKRDFMIENGLGWKDMENDITYPRS